MYGDTVREVVCRSSVSDSKGCFSWTILEYPDFLLLAEVVSSISNLCHFLLFMQNGLWSHRGRNCPPVFCRFSDLLLPSCLCSAYGCPTESRLADSKQVSLEISFMHAPCCLATMTSFEEVVCFILSDMTMNFL